MLQVCHETHHSLWMIGMMTSRMDLRNHLTEWVVVLREADLHLSALREALREVVEMVAQVVVGLLPEGLVQVGQVVGQVGLREEEGLPNISQWIPLGCLTTVSWR